MRIWLGLPAFYPIFQRLFPYSRCATRSQPSRKRDNPAQSTPFLEGYPGFQEPLSPELFFPDTAAELMLHQDQSWYTGQGSVPRVERCTRVVYRQGRYRQGRVVLPSPHFWTRFNVTFGPALSSLLDPPLDLLLP